MSLLHHILPLAGLCSVADPYHLRIWIQDLKKFIMDPDPNKTW